MNPSDPPPLPAPFLDGLKELFDSNALSLERAECWTYGYDNSQRHAEPQAVAFAKSTDQVQGLVRLCNTYRIPLTTRGRGTGTTGATVPDHGGVVLSLERMDRILQIDPGNRTARVEPGVTNLALQQAAGAHGFFWPPDPTSSAVCSIGGNLAYNSAGPRAVKYGTPRENTLALRAVSGAGALIETGCATTKGVVGYDLTRLLIGSEGTLAIITEALLKLTPLAESKRTLQAIYRDVESAAAAVSAIMAQPTLPCALEFMDGGAIDLVRESPALNLPPAAGAILIIEVDGSLSGLEAAVTALSRAATNPGLMTLQSAQTEEEARALWRARAALSPAMRRIAPGKINEDVVVPVSRIPELIHGLQQIAQRNAICIVNFGHAGNGNIHVNLLIDPAAAEEAARASSALDETFDLVLRLGGTLSGEHGVGLAKRDYVDREIGPAALELMHGVKRLFDPGNILNPGKMLPPDERAT